MEIPPSSPKEPSTKKLKMFSSTTSEEEETEAAVDAVTGDAAYAKLRRYKRRKVAIFFGYCGVGYQGMQKNPGAKTIEGDLEEALYHSGAVPEQDRGCPKRYDWARSARTDKGVSAVGQVVSGRFYVDPYGFVSRLNSNLPPQIRIFGYKRVTASFNAKKFCDRRRYVYLLPVFALDPNAHPDRESVLASLGSDNALVKCLECSERGRKVIGVMGKRTFLDPKKHFPKNLSVDDANAVASDCNVQSGVLSTGAAGMAAESEVTRDVFCPDDAEINENGSFNVVSDCKAEAEQYDVPSSRIFELPDEAVVSRAEAVTVQEKNAGDLHEEMESNICCIQVGILDSSKGTEFNRKVIDEKLLVGEGRDQVEMNRCANPVENTLKKSEFRYGEKEKERFNRILKWFEGTHNFHNFTTRTKAEDPSARRYIVSFDAKTVVSVEGIDFIKCEVVGQSFMLHQIRKMMGLAVAVMRNCASESLFDSIFQQHININVPTAPEVGLYLDECLFTSYNNKWKDSHEELSMKAYVEEAEDFKMKHIYSHIADTEHKEGVVALWLHSLNHRNYPGLLSSDNGIHVERTITEVDNMS